MTEVKVVKNSKKTILKKVKPQKIKTSKTIPEQKEPEQKEPVYSFGLEVPELIQVPTDDFAGFGEHVVKIITKSGKVLCFIGKKDGTEQVYFGNNTISIDQLTDVADFISKKKIAKNIANDNFEKAQKYVDKKFKY